MSDRLPAPLGRSRVRRLSELVISVFALGGFYHDGRFAGLADVVDHYNGHFGLGLTATETKDLIEHLKAL